MAPFVSPSQRGGGHRTSRSRSRSRERTRHSRHVLHTGLGNFQRIFREVLKIDSNDRSSADRDPSPPATAARSSSPKLGNLSKLLALSFPYRTAKSIKPTRAPSTGPQSDLKSEIEQPTASSSPDDPWHVPRLSVNRTGRASSQQTLVEDPPTVDTEGGSVAYGHSKASTPATTPDLVPDIDGLIALRPVPTELGDAIVHGGLPFPISSASFYPIPSLSVPFLMVARNYRAYLAMSIVALYNSVALGNSIVLPWDHKGDYTTALVPEYQCVGLGQSENRLTIEPLYRINKETQLQIVRARLAIRGIQTPIPLLSSPSTIQHQMVHVVRPVHVFVDLSNIVIGFYDQMRQARNLPRKQHVAGSQAPFFFGALSEILERGRLCAKRVLVGSSGPGKPRDDYILEAEHQGYTAHILQRVKGAKPSMQAPSSNPSKANAADSPVYGHHEQGVDEILQLHMAQSIIDTDMPIGADSPGVMVLATGDGAQTPYGDGFLAQILRALRAGWFVEVVSFQKNMSHVWEKHNIPAEWRSRFTKIELDPFAEELLVSFCG